MLPDRIQGREASAPRSHYVLSIAPTSTWSELMHFRAAFYPGLAILSFLAIATGACSGDDDDSTAPTGAATTVQTATRTEAATAPASPAATTAAISPTAASAPALIKVGTTAKGNVLADAAGLSLYTFDNDTTAGKSSCTGNCPNTWPPLTTTATAVPPVPGAAGQFSIITRDDGGKQVAYNGKPLYRFGADRAAGDTGGDGIGGLWHLAKP